MLKRVVKYIIILVLVILLVSGCSEFFGTIQGRIAVQKIAIEYIHDKYKIPVEQLDTDIPSYRYGPNRYATKIYDTKKQVAYLVTVRLKPKNYVVDMEESPYNPIKE